MMPYYKFVGNMAVSPKRLPTQFANKRKKLHKVVGIFKSKGEGKQTFWCSHYKFLSD